MAADKACAAGDHNPQFVCPPYTVDGTPSAACYFEAGGTPSPVRQSTDTLSPKGARAVVWFHTFPEPSRRALANSVIGTSSSCPMSTYWKPYVARVSFD